MCQLPWVPYRLLGDYINGSRNGWRTEQSRTSSAHHLYTLNHIGRYLFQSIYTGQGTEYRTRVNQYLRIRAIQPIDTYLLETTVLTIILDPHSGLKIQSLRQGGGISVLKHFHIHHINQRRCHAAGGLTTIGRHHHSVQCYQILFYLEVLLQSFPFS